MCLGISIIYRLLYNMCKYIYVKMLHLLVLQICNTQAFGVKQIWSRATPHRHLTATGAPWTAPPTKQPTTPRRPTSPLPHRIPMWLIPTWPAHFTTSVPKYLLLEETSTSFPNYKYFGTEGVLVWHLVRSCLFVWEN